MKNQYCSPRLGLKKSAMRQTLWPLRTRLIFYETLWYVDQMNSRDVFYVGKCVQILYNLINNSKIYPKCAQAMDSMGRIRTAYLLCTRITLETTALRVIWKKLAEDRCFSRGPGVCFWMFLRSQEGFQIYEKSRFFTTYGSKKIVHEQNPLTPPYSAHILWKLTIC